MYLHHISNTPLQALFEVGQHTTLQNILLLRVIVHSVALAAIQSEENPFRVMFEQVSSLADKYLPTMPEDERAAIRGKLFFVFLLTLC